MSTSIAVTTKNKMGHTYTESGKRVTITRLGLKIAKILASKQDENTSRITVGYQTSKHISKPQRVELEKIGVTSVLNNRFEVQLDSTEKLTVGNDIGFDGFAPGDLISVQGTSKGKGFAGVVKRWGFHGMPKTHGQSDRNRAPGAISSGQTLGRVRKGQKMGGRMGGKTKTVKNLLVMGFDDKTGEMLVSGSVPGPVKGLILIKKIGKTKRFDPITNYWISNQDQESKINLNEKFNE